MHAHGSSSPETSSRPFLPAAGADWLLPLYDPIGRLLGVARRRERLLDAAALRPGDRVLDLGCGTGELTLQALRREPGAHVTGLDPDPKALARARAKAERAGVRVDWHQGFGDALPFADASFDRVVSSLVFHHLTPEERRATLAEMARVLVPGGTLHVLDFGPPQGALGRALARALHHGARLDDHFLGRIPSLMGEAGLREARELARLRSPFGSLSLWQAVR